MYLKIDSEGKKSHNLKILKLQGSESRIYVLGEQWAELINEWLLALFLRLFLFYK